MRMVCRGWRSKETASGSEIFTREYSKAKVELDCTILRALYNVITE